jgi:hypothetical protein
MLYSPTDVAALVNIIITAHGSFVPAVAPITPEDGFHIMFHVFGDEIDEAHDLIIHNGDCTPTCAANCVIAVAAYLNKS